MVVRAGSHIADHLVDGIQVHKVTTTSQNKSSDVWIYDTVYTSYTWSPLTSSLLKPPLCPSSRIR
jgi:hypothetical protein